MTLHKIGLLFLSLFLILGLPVSFSSSHSVSSSKLETLIIPCDTEQENCVPYFKSMLKYIRTFTINYKLSKIFTKNKIKSLFVIFNGQGDCQDFLRRQSQDLKSAGVHLQSKEVNGQNFLMLYNLNHRLMMSCVTHYPAPTVDVVE